MIKKNFKILSVDHIAIATSSFNEINEFFKNILQLDCIAEEEIETEKVKISKFNLNNLNLEILTPTSGQSPL